MKATIKRNASLNFFTVWITACKTVKLSSEKEKMKRKNHQIEPLIQFGRVPLGVSLNSIWTNSLSPKTASPEARNRWLFQSGGKVVSVKSPLADELNIHPWEFDHEVVAGWLFHRPVNKAVKLKDYVPSLTRNGTASRKPTNRNTHVFCFPWTKIYRSPSISTERRLATGYFPRPRGVTNHRLPPTWLTFSI